MSRSWRPSVTLADLLTAPDPDALDELLGEQPCFRSPVAEYEDRAQVAWLLATIPTVVEGLRLRRQLVGERELVSFLDGEVAGRPIEAVLDECFVEGGSLAVATLMLRPFSSLRVAMRLMGDAIEANQAGRAEAAR